METGLFFYVVIEHEVDGVVDHNDQAPRVQAAASNQESPYGMTKYRLHYYNLETRCGELTMCESGRLVVCVCVCVCSRLVVVARLVSVESSSSGTDHINRSYRP